MILGIGDRHAHNILIDELTAELIHIDFGVTFEQGKALRTPETVPFRLTPDILDGFGLLGIQGTFTKSCIETLSILRENAEAILTICEVFLHDPLHRWEVSKSKQRRIEARVPKDSGIVQSPAPNEKEHSKPDSSSIHHEAQNLEARRLLTRLRQKLQGLADDGETLSVAAQVKRAIQEATDESNLAEMYFGWAPFL